ncbi:hypothetical protein BGZ65_011831, partial [Modicella reniformis]
AFLEALAGAVRDKNADVSEAATKVLEVQDTLPQAAIHTLIEALQDGNSLIRIKAVRALQVQFRSSNIKTSHAALEAVASAVRDKNINVRTYAAKVLEVQDTLPEAAIHTLIGALRDENSSVRINAVRVLGIQSKASSIAEIETSQAFLEALAGAVRDKNADVSEAATKVLEVQGILSKAAIRTLIGALQDENSSVRINALRVLRVQSRSSSIAVEALVKALRDENRDVKLEAFKALCGLEVISEEAVLALFRAFKDTSNIGKEEVRRLCHHSRSSTPATSALASIISNKDSTHRFTILNILSNDKDLPESVVLAVVDVLKDEDRMIRRAATGLMLHNVDKLPDSAILTLINFLEGDDQGVIRTVVRILGRHVRSSKTAYQGAESAEGYFGLDVNDREAKGRGSLHELPVNALRVLIAVLTDKDAE